MNQYLIENNHDIDFQSSNLNHSGLGMLLVIDRHVDDIQTLVNGALAGAKVLVLDSAKDSIEQITRALAEDKFNSLHLVSHGAPGVLYLGNNPLTLDNLDNYSYLLQEWGVPEILVYGCNVAAGDAGSEFIERLHQLTGANIAASATKIGENSWKLDFRRGRTISDIAFTTEVQARYQHNFNLTWDVENTLPNNSSEITAQFGLEVNGNFLYVTDHNGSNIDIYQINPATGAITYDSSFGSLGSGVDQFNQLIDLDFFTTTDGQTKAFVPDYNNKRIVVLDVDTQTGALNWDGTNTLPNNSSEISGQYGLEINGNFLYATDSIASNIDIYQIEPATGAITYDSSFGSLGSGVDQFGNVSAMDLDFFTTTDGQTKAFVPDFSNKRIVVLDVNTQTGALTWNEAQTLPNNSSEITGPHGIEVKDNLLYVTDRLGSNIDIYQIEPATGAITYDSSFGSLGSGVDQFAGRLYGPIDLDFFSTTEGETKAFVPDHGNRRIVVLDVANTPENTGTGNFTDSGQSLGSPNYASKVDLGDIDGDGDLDAFVTSNSRAIGNKIWLNDGSGNFTDSGQNLDPEKVSKDVELGDIDGDGDLDAFVVNSSFDGRTANEERNKVYLNNNGTFVDSGQDIGSRNTSSIKLGDIDGDGDLDAFAGNGNKVWLNDGSGTFIDSGQSLNMGGNTSNIELGDIDGDGDLDTFVANNGQANRVFLNDGNGNFTDSGQSLGFNKSLSVKLGDLDGDGDLDAFVANREPGNEVWFNDGSGNFTDSGQSLGSFNSQDVDLADVDGDGDLDAFVANTNSATNAPGVANKVWLNDGNGTFTDSGQNLGSNRSFGAKLGDLDGNGTIDAFVANENSHKVWLNEVRVNSDPVADDDTGTTNEDKSVTLNVLANDSDPDGDTLTVTEVNGNAASVGTEITLESGALVTLNEDGTFDYDPNGKFEGLNNGQTEIDTFTYTIDDGNGGTATATVTVNIDGVNDTFVKCVTGISWGDPHLVTFDGINYDFQAPGEFMLLEQLGAAQDDLEIQVRQELWGNSTTVSVNTAVATQMDGQKVGFYMGQGLSIDNTPTAIADGSTLTLGNDEISRQGNVYTFVYAGEDGIITAADDRLVVTDQGNHLNLAVHLCDLEEGEIQGLLGNGDGDRSNDFALRDGTILEQPLSFNTLSNEFADSWRIDQSESLFFYETGENTNTFTNVEFSETPFTIEDLDPEVRAAAEEAARDAEIPEGPAFEAAVLDYAITEEMAFLDSAVAVVNHEPLVSSIQGTPEDDFLEGTPEDEIITGIGGSDFLIGNGGNDIIDAGEGFDVIEAGDGNDIVDGGAEGDFISGGAGDDRMMGSPGVDFFEGGEGEDIADYSNLGAAITFDANTIVDKGEAGIDEIFEVETIIGATDAINKIDGSTEVNDANSLNVDLTAKTLTVDDDVEPKTYTVENFVNVIGTPNDDSMAGNDADNIFYGLPGDDTFVGSMGDDKLIGGFGEDTADYSTLDAAITFDVQTEVNKGVNGVDEVLGLKTIIGALGQANTIDGSMEGNEGNSFSINLENDSLIIDNGENSVAYTVENFLNASGNSEKDVLIGNDADNLLIGHAGTDFLLGQVGADTLIGVDAQSDTPGAGERDNLNGGADADLFILGDEERVFYLDETDLLGSLGSHSMAFILDFQSGLDKIQLSGVADDYVTRGSFIYADEGSSDGVVDSGDDMIAYALGGFNADDMIYV